MGLTMLRPYWCPGLILPMTPYTGHVNLYTIIPVRILHSLPPFLPLSVPPFFLPSLPLYSFPPFSFPSLPLQFRLPGLLPGVGPTSRPGVELKVVDL